MKLFSPEQVFSFEKPNKKLKTKIKLSSEQLIELALQCAIRKVQPKDIMTTILEYFLSDTEEYEFEQWLSKYRPIDDNPFLQYLIKNELLASYFNNMLNYEKKVKSIKESRIDILVADPRWKTSYRSDKGYYKNEEEYLKGEKEYYEAALEELDEYYEFCTDTWKTYAEEKGLPITPDLNSEQGKVYYNYKVYKRILEEYDLTKYII